MAPFEFVIVFVSFIYALALTHLLIAAAAMLRHRRRLTLSVPHLLWMAAALLLLVINWLSLYDFHRFERIPLRFFLMGLVSSVVQYVLCALVSPDFEAGETMDLRLFFERERVTFLAAFLVLMLLAMASNFAIAREAGLGWWGGKNFVVGAMTLAVVLALAVRRRWAQLAAPLLMSAGACGFMAAYYSELLR